MSDRLLITGGTGSFGEAVLKRFLQSRFEEIIIFSRDEKKQYDLRIKFDDPRLIFKIGDVRDYESVKDATKGVSHVFHAAALKQVPSCEFFPMEALKTNALGANNVINACVENGVEKCVLLSTDKAVYPINAMGMSKAYMEKIALAYARNAGQNCVTTVCCTRYGNVLGSRGSVVPLFLQCIKDEKPLPITDPQMTRFLMTLDESVELVETAFENANNGDIFVKKSPACTVLQLAEATCKLLNVGFEYQTIGTRVGEKKYETLVGLQEMSQAEALGDYFQIKLNVKDLNYNKYFDYGDHKISTSEEYNSNNTKQLTLEQIIDKLNEAQVI